MLQPIGELRSDLVPQAIINRPIGALVKGRGKLLEAVDDLDYYQGASFLLDGTLPFALRHCRGYPDNTSTIYLERSDMQVERITAIVSRIIEEFRLTEGDIRWQRRDDPDL